MKVGDPFKPPTQPGGAAAKAAKLVEQGVESLAGTAGKLLRGDASRNVDSFEKASAPVLHAMLDAGRTGVAAGAAAARAAGATISESGARLLGGLGEQLGRAESETRSLMRRIGELRTGGGAAEGAARSGGDLAAALLASLGAAADALAQAQDLVAAESFLESTAGVAGRGTLADTREALAGVESQIELILSQIEELRARETAEQDAPQPGTDPLTAAAQKASDAYAAIRDALDL